MKWSPVPLPSGSYADTARPFTQQEWVNWLPVKAERPGARSDLIGRDVPGLYPFAVVGSGPVRGSHNAEGSLFVVSGDTLFRIDTDGTGVDLGTIPGAGRVQMAHNQITGGNQVIVANGSSGYVWNTATEVLAQITDEGFPGAKSARFIGQMVVCVEPFGRFWYHSDLNDATSYNTINRYPAESSPDAILHVEPSQGEALVFGKRTIEVWANVVTENASFQRSTVIERGAASSHAIVTLDNSCIFLGDDGVVYRLNGYTPVPISTRAMEGEIAGYDLSKAFAFTWEDKGFKVAYFTFPGGKTFGYDVAQGEWHRRESQGLDRWRLNSLTPYNRAWIGGDYATGRLYRLDWDYHKEWMADEIVRICRPAVMHANGNRVRVHAMRFEVDMGPSPMAAAEIPPASPALAIAGDFPDSGYQGDEEDYSYTVTGGAAPYVIDVSSGALPGGITQVGSTAQVSGERSTVGPFNWVMRATDVDGRTAVVNDTSTTLNAQIYIWRRETVGIASQHAYSSHISGDVMAVGHANGYISHSTDRGETWTNAALPSGMTVVGLVKYLGDWYAFGYAGATSYAYKATGDSFVWNAITMPFSVGSGHYQQASVIGDYLYVGERWTTGNLILRRFDGTNWTSINTGIAGLAANDCLVRGVQVGGYTVFGSKLGQVLRTADLVTFGVAMTAASGQDARVAVKDDLLLVSSSNQDVRLSSDFGATFGTAYGRGQIAGANGYHFFIAQGDNVYTSFTGVDGSWTLQFDPLAAISPTSAYAGPDLAVISTINEGVMVGDVA